MLSTKKNNQGLALIEWLIVIIIIGILGAMILPMFMCKPHIAKQSEARMTLGAAKRSQTQYITENGKFADSMEALGLGLPSETPNYHYQILKSANAKSVVVIAQAKNSDFKSYTAAAFAINSGRKKTNIVSGICETDKASVTPPAMPLPPIKGSQKIQCPQGSRILGY
jgi:type IV pilus assembly protein PilA